MTNELRHFGVLGMHWGVRKSPKERAAQDSKREKAHMDEMDRRWERDAVSQRKAVAVYNHASHKMNAGEITRINNLPKYKGKNLYADKKLMDEYNAEFERAFTKALQEGSDIVFGTNPSKTKRVKVEGGIDWGPIFAFEDIKHGFEKMLVEVTRDQNGLVTSVVLKQDSMQMSDDEIEDALIHFGIPGMKWGVRRKRTPGSDSSSEDHRTASSLKKKKLSEMSNEELKKLTTRLQLEKQYKDLTKTEVSAGQKFVTDILMNTGKQVISKYLADQVQTVMDMLKKN